MTHTDLIVAEAHFGANILRDEGYPDTAPSQGVDVIAKAETWVSDPICDETEKGLYAEIREGVEHVRDLITALRAAETENARLTAELARYVEPGGMYGGEP